MLRQLPTVWRATTPVTGEIASHYAVVRESFGGEFYFAALAAKAQTVSLDLGFLGDGEWEMSSFCDDADRSPSDAKALAVSSRKVAKGDRIDFRLVDEGGAVAIFRRVGASAGQ